MTESLLSSLKIRKVDNVYSIHKPLLLLIAISNCLVKKERMDYFINYLSEIDNHFSNYKDISLQYPFGRLVNDNIWEVEGYDELMKTSSGDLHQNQLIEKKIKGGLSKDLYFKLSNDRSFLNSLVDELLSYFPLEDQALLKKYMKLSDVNENHLGEYQLQASHITDEKNVESKPQGSKVMQNSGYISYLNSLHNVDADNANALAESQALQVYFPELYQAFDAVDPLYELLADVTDKVIILTGHAGDGKSTIGLDILKRLKGLPADKPLTTPMDEKEHIALDNGGSVTIVKDMSELKDEQRLSWLNNSFNDKGSWLIVSNTGPLLNSLLKYNNQYTESPVKNIENEVLQVLDKTFHSNSIEEVTIRGFAKPLLVINVALLDNINLGASLLGKMLDHSGWEECNTCSAVNNCPIRKNRQALLETQGEAITKVRWVYQRLTAYEQRLTLRQMVSHLALSITGNKQCEQLQKDADLDNNDEGLAAILFSEAFFGYQQGHRWKDIVGIKAAELLQAMELGGNVSVGFERQLINELSERNYVLPDALLNLDSQWTGLAKKGAGSIRRRYSLRRMAYIFGQAKQEKPINYELFLDSFLQSPMLRKLDKWAYTGWNSVSSGEKRKEKKSILCVLLEVYSGFSSVQFTSSNFTLYLTMRRTNKEVVQATQLVVASLPEDDFRLDFDCVKNIPKLSYRNDQATLFLTLPLLDFITSRSKGSLGKELSPIHIAKLEWFRASLLKLVNDNYDEGKITLLKADIQGKVNVKSYYLNSESNQLESD